MKPSCGQHPILAFLLILSFTYLLQIFSPLRINTDSYRLLAMAVSVYEGQGYLVEGSPDQFPPGYPFIVSTLLHVGLGNSMSLVVLNLVCILMGLLVLRAWCKVHEQRPAAALAVAFALSSWIMIKHVTLPITEFVYFAMSSLSLLSLCIFYRKQRQTKWRWFALSAIFAYLALQCRTVGITLFAALLITAFLHEDNITLLRRLYTRRRHTLLVVGGITLLSALVVLLLVRRTEWYDAQFRQSHSYVGKLSELLGSSGIIHFIAQNVRYRCLEFGEVFMNLPQSRFPRLLPLFYLAGGIAWGVIARGAWLSGRSRHTLPMTVYLLMYVILMLLWPYYDARFWLPLLPILSMMLLATFHDMEMRWPVTKWLGRSYLTVFFALGLLALAFSTRLSFAGREFGERFGDGSTRMTYRHVFQNGRPVEMDEVNEAHARLLRIFDPRAQSIPAPGEL